MELYVLMIMFLKEYNCNDVSYFFFPLILYAKRYMMIAIAGSKGIQLPQSGSQLINNHLTINIALHLQTDQYNVEWTGKPVDNICLVF